MFLEFPDDRTTHHLDRQYMFGPSLLIAPVFVPEGEELEYYIPAGRWTSFFYPDRYVDGPIWMREVVPIDEIPVWVRPGSVLCLGPSGMGRPDYDYSVNVEVQAYEIAQGQTVTVEVPSGRGDEIVGYVKAISGYNGKVDVVAGGGVQASAVQNFQTF